MTREELEERKKYLLEEKKKITALQEEVDRLFHEQLAKKILLNSFYGALSNIYFRFFDIRLAKSITLSGQLAVKWKSIKINEFLQQLFKNEKEYIVYSDTDSCYINLSNVGNNLKKKGCSTEQIVDGIDKFCRKYIEPVIQKGYTELAEYLNVNENKLESGREIISEKFLITGKKRYASLVWDNEGVRNKEPELKVTGIEIVRSSTPEAVKKYLRNILRLFLLKPENVYKYVEHVEKEFKKLPPEKIAFPRSVSNIKKYEDRSNIYRKGTPIGSRAALIYNRYIENNDINMEPVSDGDKIKFFYTVVPNCFYNENVFGYINNIPNREEIIKYVDYNLQFNKVFFDVVHNIGEKIGYPVEKVKEVQIDDLF